MTTPKKLVLGFTALAGLGGLALSATPSTSAQTPPPPPSAGAVHHGERHPELYRALRTLARTEFDLRHANNDFGGHKAKAADLCHAAQDEIHLALQYDRN